MASKLVWAVGRGAWFMASMNLWAAEISSQYPQGVINLVESTPVFCVAYLQKI